MDSPGPCQPRFKIFERLLFDDFWVNWIDIDFEYTKIWSKYIPTSRTVKVPKRVRFWQENVHFSAAIHSSAFQEELWLFERCAFSCRDRTRLGTLTLMVNQKVLTIIPFLFLIDFDWKGAFVTQPVFKIQTSFWSIRSNFWQRWQFCNRLSFLHH